MDEYGKLGVFHPTKVAYRVFPSPIQQGFLPVNLQVFPPATASVCVGLDRIRIRH